MVEVRRLHIEGPLEIVPRKFADDRGFFSETFNEADLVEHGIDHRWVQDNHAYSSGKGILRGMHFQRPPFAQAKLVRVARGSIFDVVVDLRQRSPTFGKWIALELSAAKWNQLYIPVGFAHGYLTLGEAEVLYKVSVRYMPDHEQAVRFDDPAIGIEWPLPLSQITTSEKDRNASPLADSANAFLETA